MFFESFEFVEAFGDHDFVVIFEGDIGIGSGGFEAYDLVDIEDGGAFGGADGDKGFAEGVVILSVFGSGDFEHSAFDGVGGNGFEDIVEGAEFVCADGVVFVGCGEDDFVMEGVGGKEFEEVGAFVEGHVDIEEDEVGGYFVDEVGGVGDFFGFADDGDGGEVGFDDVA